MATFNGKKNAQDFPATPNDENADRILKAIRRILRRTAEHSRQLSREAGMTAPQLLCLRVIGQAGGENEMTAVQLTEVVQLTAATVSRILDQLEVQGMILRERTCADRRKVRLRLTRAGRARLKKLPIPLQESFLKRLEALPAGKRQQLLKSLETIVEMMGAEGLDVSPVLTPGVDAKTVG